jgi:hypothetical protein
LPGCCAMASDAVAAITTRCTNRRREAGLDIHKSPRTS